MNRRLMKSLLAAAGIAAPLALGLGMAPPAAAQSVQRATSQDLAKPTGEIIASIGRGQLVTIPAPMSDIFIVDDDIVDIQVKSDRQFYIWGKTTGETTVYASNRAGDVVWSTVVRVASNIESVDQMLALAMPDAKITVSTMGQSTVLLTGTVATPEDASEATRLVGAFLGDKVSIISRLKMATPLQVNLQVRFAEVSRTLVREMSSNLITRDTSGSGILFGINRGRDFGNITGGNFAGFPVLDASAQFGFPPGTIRLPFNTQTGQFITAPTMFPQGRNNVGQTAISLAGRLFGLDIAGTLDAAERVGLATTLSQPNLTALSGETADFLAGGEFPIPISQGLGSTSIEYKKFGVSLSYTPIVLANGRISMRVRPEVSELTSQGAVTLNGFQIPGMSVRRAETTVELGSGQSFMIAGLLSNNANNTIEKTPGAGDLPILGSLFRSTNFRKGETELVIIVTPYLVNPVDGNDIKLPTDGYHAPNELQRVLGNYEADGRTGGTRPMPTAAPAPMQNPVVGSIDPAALPAPAPSATAKSQEARSERKPSRNRRTASAATPGFNLD